MTAFFIAVTSYWTGVIVGIIAMVLVYILGYGHGWYKWAIPVSVATIVYLVTFSVIWRFFRKQGVTF